MSVKAFELVLAVERELLMGDKPRINIECIECCGKNIYIGTNDCFLHHFLLEEKSSSKGNPAFAAQKQLQRHLGLKKPVNELKAASALNRLIVLCDNTIMVVNMLNLEPVPSGAKIKGVVTFTVNENPVNGDPFCVEIGVISVKKRTIQIYMVYEDRVQIVKELSTPEQPSAIGLDGYFLCLALTTQYIILNYNTGASQDLFPYDSEERKPIVKRIGREEFLLAAPGGLGMFATAAGISQRAPVRWSENVIGAAVCFPYVVALDEGFITVHSMLDQQLKQTLSFRDGHILQDFEGKVVLTTTKAVYVLVPLPLERQIQDLLASHRVEEALVLAEGARRNIPKDKFQVMYRRILQQAGFIQFGRLQFSEAKEHFRKGHLDVRELISLYPLLLPTTSTFTRSHPPLHEFADLNHLTQGDQKKILKCKRFLISYLSEIRSTEVANGYRDDVDTALLKLYAEANHESLLDLLVSENACVLMDSVPWLEKHKKFFALGLLYHYNGQDDAAVQLWMQIVNGELHDDTRADLYEYIVDFLTFSSKQDLIWKYADWALQKNEKVGVQIFTKRPEDEEKKGKLNPDNVIKYLHKYSQAIILYLEHLVFEKNIQKEKFHSHLAALYLDRVLQLHSQSETPSEELSSSRTKLQNLLQKSNLYRVQLLLGKIKDTDLKFECAILYGKLEEYDKALHILVHQLKDFQAAERYCLWASEDKDPSYRQRLFHMLLALYMDPSISNDALVMAAVDLLNRHAEVFDAVRVLRLVPESWSVQLLCPFLSGAIRESMHSKRMSQVALGLARSENIIHKHEKMKSKGGPIFLSEKKGCQLCHNTFSEPEFVFHPSGIPIHTHCAAKRNRESPSRRQYPNVNNHT
ncbi:transforming growth factor-beta receptor-associated protein 1 homolog [Lepisosteus oculatus]|uniref:Transforming growth factor, beta receptor associated protein 1 n=1 Tax=Lepisosteus oculatus TaxID=7918 RepID=W5MQH8_LEPOC|nr:PREDICTED: transforming growth factor-beta receptor-associated protein 1 [Lepisosteus oculatus]XP_015219881.1 PREDICTED: transforming growth factor-beta receptor-associated protein 1 [Lepisosteus oculatus]XP_015219882.1 PREDICTED: transforming growth factor-beta receptor-associated protein 1 [Lepisosteus oculatus]XP_015219883.1 PREDICTED: transforming growth factor-beta receptor-associated protein 1 [Lepisosteus oculatus]